METELTQEHGTLLSFSTFRFNSENLWSFSLSSISPAGRKPPGKASVSHTSSRCPSLLPFRSLACGDEGHPILIVALESLKPQEGFLHRPWCPSQDPLCWNKDGKISRGALSRHWDSTDNPWPRAPQVFRKDSCGHLFPEKKISKETFFLATFLSLTFFSFFLKMRLKHKIVSL